MTHNAPAPKAQNLGTLFFTFFKIGLFTFGGGYAMIALLEEEFIQRRRWLDKDEFLDMTAIAESTPGPVAINSATYLGYKLAGVPGAAACRPSSSSTPSRCFLSSSPSSPSLPTPLKAFRSASSISSSRPVCGCCRRSTAPSFLPASSCPSFWR